MLIAGYDVETTGLDTTKEHIIQVGVVLWDTEAKTKKAKIKYDALICDIHTPEVLDPKITEITGIIREDLTLYGKSFREVMENVYGIFKLAGAILAHNGHQFDRPITEAELSRYQMSFLPQLWIDSTCDVEFDSSINTRKLSYLATEHHFINPFPHDALSDVMPMLKIADKYDWEKTLAWAKAPTLTVRADSTFQQKELVKKQNYRWDGESKTWFKSIKDFQLADTEKAAKDAGFGVTVLKNFGGKKC